MANKVDKIPVVIFEDDEGVVTNLRKNLERLGWVVFAVVSNMDEVDGAIQTMVSSGVKFAFVDGNLDQTSKDNVHGKVIVGKLRAAGITSIENAQSGKVGADIEAGKDATSSLASLRAVLEKLSQS